jgi:hypothetical protein
VNPDLVRLALADFADRRQAWPQRGTNDALEAWLAVLGDEMAGPLGLLDDVTPTEEAKR